VVLPACGGAPEAPPDIYLIVIDTVRADHLSLYGYDRPTTPELARRAEAGMVFENAFSAAAWTLPGFGSILTGTYPGQHGAGMGGPSRIDDTLPILPEILAEAGYDTGAVANVSFLNDIFGLNRGFAHYDFDPAGDVEGTRRADISVDLGLEWIDRPRDTPMFFMLHLFDAHRHYDAPPPARGVFTTQFADGYDPETLATLESRLEAERRSDLDFHVAAYDEELLWLDMQLERFFAELEARGRFEDALVILTSDHGEAFYEHHAIGHGSCLHNEITRVPFMIWEPGRSARGRVSGAVSTVDILPTVLDYAGLPDAGGAGVSLRGAMRGEEPAVRGILSQNRFYDTYLTALVRWPFKLILDHKNDHRMLYDLSVDPGETQDLAVDPDDDTAQLIRTLRREARDLRQGKVGAQVELSPEVAERLRALGYIQ
jgi:arylsulfatase A-like enzyme